MTKSDSALDETASPRPGFDRATRAIVIAILVVIIAIFTVLLWAVAGGVFEQQAPRTFIERQIDMLETVVVEKPTSEEAWADYALALGAARQFSKADDVLDEADLALGGEVIDTLVVRASLAFDQGDSERALELVRRAIAVGLEFRESEMQRLAAQGLLPEPNTVKGPILASAYALEARLLAAQELWDEAAVAYTRALQEEPASADVLVLRGHVYLQMSSVDSATADFEQALRFIPGFSPALEGLDRVQEGSE